ncbi:MAG: hypothetical protein AB8B62_14910 [Roseobacter sp.]
MGVIAAPVDNGSFETQAAPSGATEQPNPLAALVRAMRGRWSSATVSALLLGSALTAAGYFAGVQLYESRAILRVYPQESNILYATGNGSVLKTFDSFVKAETTYVASDPVMTRSAQTLADTRPEQAKGLRVSDLTGSVEIKRSDSLIVLKTQSKDRDFARQKLDAVITSYLTLKAETEARRTEVRLSELFARETVLSDRLAALRADQLDIGGEFGLNALAKAHIEKIAKIDGLAARKSEVAATLLALEAKTNASSADTADQEIMRATLLDRAMADLSFERAKLMSELAALRAGFLHHSEKRFRQMEQAKLDQIAVIEKAAADRRAQIRVLGQTGALTDVADGSSETTLTEMRSLYQKVTGQLTLARQEARDLNRRRIDLDGIENEIDEAQDLLEETRHALEVIRLESGRALPGYAVVMSPPSHPDSPAEDTRKMLMAAGMLGGIGLALALTLARALTERRIRFAETLAPVADRLPVLQVCKAGEDDPHAADILRNALQLQSIRTPRLVGKAPVIAVTQAQDGDTGAFARALADSFARAQMKTLLIDADLGKPDNGAEIAGWRDLLRGGSDQLRPIETGGNLWEFTSGTYALLEDRMVSAAMVKSALDRAAKDFDVVIVATGSLSRTLSTQFVLSHSDVGVLVLNPMDKRGAVFPQINRLDDLPRNGSVAVLRNARSNDPDLERHH